MNLVEIETFLAIAELGSLVKASRRLNVTASAVTSRVHSLEEQIGEPLFYRNKSGATLTSEGFRFQRYAEAMTDLWRQARKETKRTQARVVCNLGCHVDIWRDIGAGLLTAINQSDSEAIVSVWPGKQGEFEQWLATGLIDAAVTYRLKETARHQSVYELPAEELVLCASEPTSSPESGPAFIHVDSGGNFSTHFTQTFPQAKIGNMSFGSSIWALEYLLGHCGKAYLPKYLVDKHLERDELFLVKGAETFTRSRYLVTNKLAQANWNWIAELTPSP
jgi:DNA-binding transcriptional LysR family regulator